MGLGHGVGLGDQHGGMRPNDDDDDDDDDDCRVVPSDPATLPSLQGGHRGARKLSLPLFAMESGLFTQGASKIGMKRNHILKKYEKML